MEIKTGKEIKFEIDMGKYYSENKKWVAVDDMIKLCKRIDEQMFHGGSYSTAGRLIIGKLTKG